MLRYVGFIFAAGAMIGTIGCTSGTAGEVKLGVDVAAITAQTTNDASAVASGDLAVSRVRVLAHEIKIGYTGGSSHGGPVAEAGPFVVDLTADEIANGAHREFSLGTVASGTYGGAEIEIEPLYASDDTSDPALADFVSTGAAVLIDGTYKGASFQFAGHFLAEQGTDGDVTVDAATPVSLALTIDPSSWLKGTDASAEDPTDATLHDGEAVAICKTLDTEPSIAQAPIGDGGAPRDAHHAGMHGGGQQAHCIEGAVASH